MLKFRFRATLKEPSTLARVQVACFLLIEELLNSVSDNEVGRGRSVSNGALSVAGHADKGEIPKDIS